MITINLYVDGEPAELLIALADHYDVTVEEYANELFNKLITNLWHDIKEEYFN